MSKLDKILEPMDEDADYRAIKKQLIKDLMLELIGQTEEKDRFGQYVIYSSKLRQKVSDL